VRALPTTAGAVAVSFVAVARAPSTAPPVALGAALVSPVTAASEPPTEVVKFCSTVTTLLATAIALLVVPANVATGATPAAFGAGVALTAASTLPTIKVVTLRVAVITLLEKEVALGCEACVAELKTMRIRFLLAIVIGLLCATNQSFADTVGRWQLMPVIGPPIDVGGTPHYYAWRLDTVTGDLQMCAYDPGGWKRLEAPDGVVKETLDCTTPLAAPAPRQAARQ